MRDMAARVWRRLLTPMAPLTRNVVAFVLAAAAFGVGSYAFMYGTADMGVTLGYATTRDGTSYIVVADVAPWSEVAGQVSPGDAVVAINDQTYLPQLADSFPGGVVDPGLLIGQPPWSFQTAPADQFEEFLATGALPQIDYWSGSATADWLLDESGSAPILGLVILVAGGWWLLGGGGGETMRRMAIPAVTAVAAPLLLVPAAFQGGGGALASVAILLPLAQLPFADALAAEIDDVRRREHARLIVLGTLVLAAAAGLLVINAGAHSPAILAQWIAVGAIAGVAGLLASRPAGWAARAGGSASGRLAESLELAAAGVTPFIAMIALVAPNAPPLIFPLLLWILALVAAQRFTVRPFARMATTATLQRDLVVAATEAERARIAADLHDVAIQELTMLARRLDVRGEADDAQSARRVVEQLRTITGELRLPILDDLGVGPALEWLVGRMERLAGGEVRLERDDGSRLPLDVELAFFRVAQEALANAVKHGRPPIVVRYRASATGATLTVDDAGPGIATGAAEAAPAAGHFGLLGMQQRAEQIGALLDVRRWPAGGTHVGLDWRAR